MFGQTFDLPDLGSVGSLILLEGLLSADNALVLALMVRHLKEDEQKRALLYGLGGAFVFRFIAIMFASVVLQQWWLQAIGAAYLIYLPLKHFKSMGMSAEKDVKTGGGFWQTVIAVELTDIAFALDSVLAGIGFITRPGAGMMMDKLWVVYTGAILGIILLRFAAGVFVKLLDRFPALDHMAYVLVGWVGIKLALHSAERYEKASGTHLPFPVPHLTEPIFWGGLLSIVVVGTTIAYIKRKPTAPAES